MTGTAPISISDLMGSQAEVPQGRGGTSDVACVFSGHARLGALRPARIAHYIQFQVWIPRAVVHIRAASWNGKQENPHSG
jgi:hypothetical protein